MDRNSLPFRTTSRARFASVYVALLLACWSFPERVVAQFSNEIVISTQAEGASQVYAADIDNDGDLDVLSASLLDNKIAWYENTNGAATFGVQRVISLDALKVSALHIADLDNDGNLDVLSASRDDNKVAWYPNLGAGVFGAQQVISTEAFVAQSVYTADLDGDGDLDVLSASRDDNKIAWYEHTNGQGAFGPQQVISTTALWANRVIAQDIDGDGDLDVVSASEQDDKLAWYPNTNGAGVFGDEQIITQDADAVRDMRVADLDSDGDFDILAASSADDRVVWYPNTDGLGTFGAALVINASADFAHAVYAADLDDDGDLDVLSGSVNDSKIAWYENTNGQGSFGPQQLVSTASAGPVSIVAANVDGDGDVDILVASTFDNKIAWYESFAGKGLVRFGVTRFIGNTTESLAPHAVAGADIDGDGYADVLSASYNDSKIAWYPNVHGRLGQQRTISLGAAGARDVHAADIDGDGDQDVLSASGSDNAIRWYENFNGAGSFDITHDISTNANSAYAVYAADLDGDGDMDVLSASSSDDKIAWYQNDDGNGTFGSQLIVTKAAKGATDVVAADIDGDGDQDIVSASTFDDKIAWYENTDGQGTFGAQQVISTDADLAIAVHVVDLDGDGDLDVLSASSGDNKIAWYKNLDGQGSFGSQAIISLQVARAFSVYAADLDSDGDQDVIAGARDGNKVVWFENQEGTLFSGERIIASGTMGVRSVTAFDLDRDGDDDVFSASQDDNIVAWYENLSFVSNVLSTEDAEQPGVGYALSGFYPNPFAQQTQLEIAIARSQVVEAVVYDIQGRTVATLYQGMMLADQPYRLRFIQENLPAGLYMLRVQGAQFVATRKVMLVR
ncbi:MAG: T9SS type A sorting domain-containing protein [Bacteroidota bacterium]